ncbi:MAG: NTP transferase domain-containing protein [Acidimicrobiales bacterium]|nr:NTP transferase domain-containing protein [Acidimicrobiales bacterium]
MTTALVLAAGLGTRLRGVTSGPKWLVPVGDSSPMQEQVRALDTSERIDQVVVVASGDTTALRRGLASIAPSVPVEVILNPDADRWNNWSSALIGIEHIGEESIVLFNSDLFAARGWFVDGIERIVGVGTPALLIDDERPLTDEAMKVAGTTNLTAIGKTGIDAPVGEYVGMAWWPAGTSHRFATLLRSYRDDPDAAQNWYEHGIQEDMRSGTSYARVPTPSMDWVEIDDEHDHQLAQELARAVQSRSARYRTD